MKVLVTGFEPFGPWQRNPSAETARRLDGATIIDAKVTGIVLPVSFRRVTVPLLAALTAVHPDVVLHLGLGDPVGIRVERFAANRCLAPKGGDNDGYEPNGEPVVSGGPPRYPATLPVAEIVQLLARAHVPVAPSDCAGTFLCNYVMYTTLHYISMHNLPMRAGFIHASPLAEEQVPLPEEKLMSLNQWFEFAEAVVSLFCSAVPV